MAPESKSFGSEINNQSHLLGCGHKSFKRVIEEIIPIFQIRKRNLIKTCKLFKADFRYHDHIFGFGVECHFKIEKKCKPLK